MEILPDGVRRNVRVDFLFILPVIEDKIEDSSVFAIIWDLGLRTKDKGLAVGLVGL